MKSYHKLLWSKPLPNGDILQLEDGKDCYLKWNGMFFGSDSITATFRNGRNKQFEEFKKSIPNYPEFEKDVLSKLYTIGGAIIFQIHPIVKYQDGFFCFKDEAAVKYVGQCHA